MYIKPNDKKLIPFLEDMEKGYLIYEDGNLYKTVSRQAGKLRKLEKPLLIKAKVRGYKVVSRYYEGKRIQARQHRLIYAWFYGLEALAKYDSINHEDGDKDNNRIENLTCMSRKDNEKHKNDTGLTLNGSKHGNSIFTEEQVIYIKNELKKEKYGTCARLAREFGVTKTAVYDIKRGRTWGHIVV